MTAVCVAGLSLRSLRRELRRRATHLRNGDNSSSSIELLSPRAMWIKTSALPSLTAV